MVDPIASKSNIAATTNTLITSEKQTFERILTQAKLQTQAPNTSQVQSSENNNYRKTGNYLNVIEDSLRQMVLNSGLTKPPSQEVLHHFIKNITSTLIEYKSPPDIINSLEKAQTITELINYFDQKSKNEKQGMNSILVKANLEKQSQKPIHEKLGDYLYSILLSLEKSNQKSYLLQIPNNKNWTEFTQTIRTNLLNINENISPEIINLLSKTHNSGELIATLNQIFNRLVSPAPESIPETPSIFA